MNREGGCCIARYGGGGGGGGGGRAILYRGMTDVEKIMLKFRPIAPKPVAAGSGGSATENSDGGYVKCSVRSKRKYVRVVNKNSNNKKKKKINNSKRCSSTSGTHEKMKVQTSSTSPPLVTLSLLPETPDRKECSPVDIIDNSLDLGEKIDYVRPTSLTHNNSLDLNKKVAHNNPLNLSKNVVYTRPTSVAHNNTLDLSKKVVYAAHNSSLDLCKKVVYTRPILQNNSLDLSTPVQTRVVKPAPVPGPVWLSFEEPKVVKPLVAPPPPSRGGTQVVSYVTVECVTDTCGELEGLGCTDEERMMNMEKDTCPGFITDGQDHHRVVVWTNTAFRKMVGVGEDTAAVVVLVNNKDIIWSPVVSYQLANFSCKVRVTTTSAFEGHRQRQTPPPTLMLPCDVWRMKCGACAWRLDVKAALSLGR